MIDYFGPGIFLALEKFSGGTGKGRWTKGDSGDQVSAVSATLYTVSSGGALLVNALIYARGFATAGNNGLKVVTASAGTTITCAGLAVETPSAGMQLEFCGHQGAAGDITLNASGNLTSTLLDFTTLGLQVGQWMKLGGSTAGTQFATAALNDLVKIKTVAANVITFERRYFVIAADTGATKTIQMFFGSYLRNVAIDHADYLETTYSMERSEPGAAAAGATDYVYAVGNLVDTFELNAPLTDLTRVTMSFVGKTCSDPTTTRTVGASVAIPPVATAALNTVAEERKIRIANQSDEVVLTGVNADINNWKLTIKNNVTPQKGQGLEGAARMIVGKCETMIDTSLYYLQNDIPIGIHDNRTVAFDVLLRNNDGAQLYDCPEGTLEGGDPQHPANGPVTMPVVFRAHRSATYSCTVALSRFPYMP